MAQARGVKIVSTDQHVGQPFFFLFRLLWPLKLCTLMCSARSIPILGLCALATSLTLGCLPSKNAKPRPLASRGVIDLREWDFEKDGPIDLKGEWEFYWKKLLAPSDLASAGPRPALAKSYIQAPGKWNAHVVDGKEIGGQGFATYRLKVLLPPKSEGLGFHIPDGQG